MHYICRYFIFFTLISSCLENLNRFVCGVARVRGVEKWVRFGFVGLARGLRTGNQGTEESLK